METSSLQARGPVEPGMRFVRSGVSALDTAALMLGTDKSRGYCFEMICADFLAGTHLEDADPKILLSSTLRLFQIPAGRTKARIPTEGSSSSVS